MTKKEWLGFTGVAGHGAFGQKIWLTLRASVGSETPLTNPDATLALTKVVGRLRAGSCC